MSNLKKDRNAHGHLHLAVFLPRVGPTLGGIHASAAGFAKSFSFIKGNSVDVYVTKALDQRDIEHLKDFGDFVRVQDLFSKVRTLGGASKARNSVSLTDKEFIYHIHGLWGLHFLIGFIIALLKRRKLVVSPQGMFNLQALRYSPKKKKICRALGYDFLFSRVNAWHSFNDEEGSAIREQGFKQPIFIIPNGVDLPKIHQSRLSGSYRLLYIGRIHSIKNLKSLLRAWRQLCEDESAKVGNWTLTVAGWEDGLTFRELEFLFDGSSAPKVEFKGPVFGIEKETLFRESSAFILPSLSEGHPMTVVEAWSYGLPVLMTRQCNLPEGFRFGAALEIGVTVESIGSGILELVSLSDDKRNEIGNAGRKLVEEFYTWQQQAEKFDQCLSWLSGIGTKPSCVKLD